MVMGGGTFVLSIPKEWAKKNGVKKGTTLAVEELSMGKLMIRPIDVSSAKPREFAIDFTGEDLRQVVSDVTGAYLLGYELIKIGGRKVIARGERAVLKDTLSRLIGLEIMDEDSKQITVQFLLEHSAIDPERLVRRMSGILEGMMRDTATALAGNDRGLLSLVAERDDEVDRLYFLLVRTIRTATLHPELAERYGLGPVDVLDYRVLASFLESVGDAVAELSKKLHRLTIPPKVAKDYSRCVLLLIDLEDLATRSFLSRKTGRSREVYSRIETLGIEIEEGSARIAQLAGAEGYALVETLGTLDRIGKLLVDVSDLATTAQLVS